MAITIQMTLDPAEAEEVLGDFFNAFQKEAERGERGAQGFSDAVDGWGSSLSGVLPILGAVTAAATAAGAAILGMASHAAAEDGEIGRIADVVGATTAEIAGLSFAARQYKVDNDDLLDGLKDFTVRMQEAADGTGTGAEFLRKLGIQVVDAQGKLRPTVEVFGEFSDKLKDLPDNESLVFMDELLNDVGVRLAPVLKQGAAGFREAAEEAKAFGLQVSEADKTLAREFNVAVERAKAVVSGLSIQFGREFIPAVTDALKAATELGLELSRNIPWEAIGRGITAVGNALDLIARSAQTAYENLKELDPEEIPILGGAIAKIRTSFNWLSDGLNETWDAAKKLAEGFDVAWNGERKLEEQTAKTTDAAKTQSETMNVLGTITKKAAEEALALADAKEEERAKVDDVAESTRTVAEEVQRVETQTQQSGEGVIRVWDQINSVIRTATGDTINFIGAVQGLEGKIHSLTERARLAKTSMREEAIKDGRGGPFQGGGGIGAETMADLAGFGGGLSTAGDFASIFLPRGFGGNAITRQRFGEFQASGGAKAQQEFQAQIAAANAERTAALIKEREMIREIAREASGFFGSRNFRQAARDGMRRLT